MAFQTSVLENGEWVTRTVNLNDVPAPPDIPIPDEEELSEQAPNLGILSRTIVKTPTIRTVLPVRLRSRVHNDIVFIGHDFVQISELVNHRETTSERHRVPHLVPILRLQDVGFRIRNAVVLGSHYSSEGKKFLEEDEPLAEGSHFKLGDLGSSTSTPPATLPPQLLVLALESGHLILCFIQTAHDGTPSLNMTLLNEGNPRTRGHLLAADPHARYLVSGDPNGVLVIYGLRPRHELEAQFRKAGRLLDPVISTSAREIQGVVHRLAFLHPERETDHSAVHLVLVVVTKKTTSQTPTHHLMLISWLVGGDLQGAFEQNVFSRSINASHQVPLDIVPLLSKGTFLLVCPTQVFLVQGILSRRPIYTDVNLTSAPPTDWHWGSALPSWVSWARPFRRKSQKLMDNIYVAREDGALILLNFHSGSGDVGPTFIPVAGLDANISTAFAIADDRWSDVLIVGGDLGAASIWEILPRKGNRKISAAPQWSSITDATAEIRRPPAALESLMKLGAKRSALSSLTQSIDNSPGYHRSLLYSSQYGLETLYTTATRGPRNSAITQWRFGMQARVTLEIDVEEALANKLWTFMDLDSDDLFTLVGLPRSSILLRFPRDLEQAEGVLENETDIDLDSRTLCVYQAADGSIVQVTESHVTLGGMSNRIRHPIKDLLGIPGNSAELATIRDQTLFLATHSEGNSQIHGFLIKDSQVQHFCTLDVQGEVTSMCLIQMRERVFTAVASVYMSQTYMSVYSEEIVTPAVFKISQGFADSPEEQSLDALTSLDIVQERPSEAIVVGGSRNGRFVTFSMREGSSPSLEITWLVDKVGNGPATVFPSGLMVGGRPTSLACCDGKAIMMTGFSQSRYSGRSCIWATDSNDFSKPQPEVSWVCKLPFSVSGESSHLSLMFLAGSTIMVAEVLPVEGHFPRSIPVANKPTRILFSTIKPCLIVCMTSAKGASVALVDPKTGKDISLPTNSDKQAVEILKGLETPGDQIHGLHEWTYQKEENIYCYIVVTTVQGTLAILSLEDVRPTDGGQERRIRLWTRFKIRHGKPIYSVTTHGANLFYCVDHEIHWNVLEGGTIKPGPGNPLKLESPTTCLSAENGKLLAMTTNHSLHVIAYSSSAVPPGLKLEFVAQATRPTTHMMVVRQTVEEGLPSVILLADATGGIETVWVPWGFHGRSLEQLTSGQLSAPIRRLIKGRFTQPGARIPASKYNKPRIEQSARNDERDGGRGDSRGDDWDDNSLILGVSVGGSLIQLTVVEEDLVPFLTFVEDLARKSLGPFAQGLQRARGQRGHIDGDVLSRCVEKRALETLVEDDGSEDGGNGDHFSKLTKLLSVALKFAPERLLDARAVFDQAYDVLEDLTRLPI